MIGSTLLVIQGSILYLERIQVDINVVVLMKTVKVRMGGGSASYGESTRGDGSET